MRKKLSIIIPSRDEGQAPFETVESLLSCCKPSQVDIVVVDNEMIPEIQNIPKARVIHCNYPGFGEAIQAGIDVAKYDNLLICGARTRFTEGFVDKILNAIKDNPDGISCGISAVLRAEQMDIENAELRYGAHIVYDWRSLDKKDSDNSLTAKTYKWLLNFANKEKPETLECVYGGHYILTKKWWDYIRGLKGIKTRGGCNQFLSLKTIGAGGQLKLVDDLIIGNVYRERTSYPVPAVDVLYNRIFILTVLGGLGAGLRALRSYEKNPEYSEILYYYGKFYGEILKERHEFLKIRKRRLTFKS